MARLPIPFCNEGVRESCALARFCARLAEWQAAPSPNGRRRRTGRAALVRRVFEEVWKQHNVKAIDGLFAPDHLGHDPNTGHHIGREAEKSAFQAYITAFPDIHFEVEEQPEGELVATRWTASGTHRGTWWGSRPSPAAGRLALDQGGTSTTGSFDYTTAPKTGTPPTSLFLGDYDGLTATGSTFRAFFAMSAPIATAGPSDLFTNSAG